MKKIILILGLLFLMNSVNAWTYENVSIGKTYGIQHLAQTDTEICIAYISATYEFRVSCRNKATGSYTHTGIGRHDSTGYAAYAIAMDNSDNWALAFMNGTDLEYYHETGGLETGLATDGDIVFGYKRRGVGLAFDSNNYPHISKADGNAKNFDEHYYNGTAWVTLLIKYTNYITYRTSIAITSTGKKYTASMSMYPSSSACCSLWFCWSDTVTGTWTCDSPQYEGSTPYTDPDVEIMIDSTDGLYFTRPAMDAGGPPYILNQWLYKSDVISPTHISNFTKIWNKNNVSFLGGLYKEDLSYLYAGNLIFGNYESGLYTNETITTADSYNVDIVVDATTTYLTYTEDNTVFLAYYSPNHAPVIDRAYPSDNYMVTDYFNVEVNISDPDLDSIETNITCPDGSSIYYHAGLPSGSTISTPWTCGLPVYGTSYNYTVYISDGTENVTATYNFSAPVLACTSSNDELSLCCNLSGIPDDLIPNLRITDIGSTYNCGSFEVTTTGTTCYNAGHGVAHDKNYELKIAYGYSGDTCDDFYYTESNIFNLSTYECYENETPTGCPEGYNCTVHSCTASNLTYNASEGNTTLTLYDWINVNAGEIEAITAYYTHHGQPITGASCTYSSDALISSGYPYGELYEVSSHNYFVPVQVKDTIAGNYSYTVTCSRSGYPTLQAQDNFTVYNATTKITDITWTLSPSLVEVGHHMTFTAVYHTSGGIHLSGATCILNIGLSDYTMTDWGDGVYYDLITASHVGVYSYYIICNLTGYLAATSTTKSYTAYEEGEEPPEPEPDHCSDGVENYDESDIDCGGSCDPCANGQDCEGDDDNCYSEWCYNGVCTSPSCSDNIMNGGETGIDCGGPCPACMCFQNWDCAPDGSERCIDNSCVDDTCTTNADCISILWYDLEYGYYTADRECYNFKCRFTTENETTGDIYLNIFPQVYLVWNDSGRKVFISNCEESTNYFTAKTNVPTQNWYFLSDPVFYSPYATPLGTNYLFGDEEYSAITTDEIAPLCLMPSAYDRIYSLITFYATDGTYSRYKSIYTLTFKDAFKVNATYLAEDQINISISRNATCSYRTSTKLNWTQINAVEATLITLNVSTSQSLYIKCSNTYGEEAEITYQGGIRLVWNFIFFIAASIFNRIFFIVTGSTFLWYDWYILPLVVLALFVFPTLLLVLLYDRRKRREVGSDRRF